MEVLILLIVVLALISLGMLSHRFGADSRSGFTDTRHNW